METAQALPIYEAELRGIYVMIAGMPHPFP